MTDPSTHRLPAAHITLTCRLQFALCALLMAGLAAWTPGRTGIQPAPAFAQVPTVTPLPEPTISGEPPPAYLEIAGARRPMAVSTYCWEGGCVDAVGLITPPEPMTATFPAEAVLDLEATRGVEFLGLRVMPVTMDMASELTAGRWRGKLVWDVTAVDVASGSVRTLQPIRRQATPLDLKAGLHLVWLSVNWVGFGDAQFSMLVHAQRDAAGDLYLPWLSSGSWDEDGSVPTARLRRR